MRRFHLLAPLLVSHLTLVPSASAQWLPDQPIRLFDGRLRLAGDASATLGARDDEAFFNYTDYERNALRTLRLGLIGEWQPASRIAVLAEIRTDDFERFTVAAAYLRVRPLERVPLDVQAGRIPPVFGSFGRRSYASERPLIGYPLAYQYLTSLRADALPATADDLLRMRGRGWLTSFPVGDQEAAAGLPMVSAFRWDTGVQARWARPEYELAMSVTQGTLSNPRIIDDNGGKQVAVRALVRPSIGLAVAGSMARGSWISRDVPMAGGRTASQTSLGADIEYSAGHLLVRSELVWTRWQMPFAVVPPEGDRLRALAAWTEARYRLSPRLYVAARADRLSFSDITGSPPGSRPTSWDAGVSRLEVGGGLTLQRGLVLRTVVQINRRDGGRVGRRTYLSSQVAWWF